MSSPVEGGRRRGRGSSFLVGLTGLIILVALGAFVLSQWRRESPSTEIRLVGDGRPNIDIYAYDLETGIDARLTDDPRPDVDPVWSPDGSQIAFARFTGLNNDLHDLYVMNADGTDERLLLGGSSDDIWPSWSPDGAQIVFMSDRSSYGDIFSVDVATGELRVKRISDSPTGDELPDWSPVDDRIAYVDERPKANESRIFTVRSDGSDEQTVTRFRECCGIEQVEWSPDGKELAITWLRYGHADVWRVVVGSGDKKRVTYGSTGDGFVSWSPDGRRLVFMTNRHTPNGDDLYVVDTDGSDEQELVRTPWYEGNPDWSPRGDSIVFESIYGADT